MRWSEADLESYLRRGQPAPLSEKAWQTAVLRLLEQSGYALRYHTWDSRKSPSGFPDIVACHRDPGHAALALELKTETGQVTLPQQQWLDALRQCSGVYAHVLRPAGLEAFVAQLRIDVLP